jgi:hypothetical protein
MPKQTVNERDQVAAIGRITGIPVMEVFQALVGNSGPKKKPQWGTGAKAVVEADPLREVTGHLLPARNTID